MPTRLLTLAGWLIDLAQRRIQRDGVERSLSTKEAQLLAYLAGQPGRSVPRSELLQEVWGYSGGASTRTVDVTVARLRRKLEDQPPQCLLTDRGAGYRLAGAAPAVQLVGREEDLGAITAAAESGAALVTLLGPPGGGTSSVAAAAAERLGARFVDEATPESVAPQLSNRQLVIAAARAPLVLPGEHRHYLAPLSSADAVALLRARLDAAGRVRPAGLDRRLAVIAAGLEGHAGLLVAAGDKLAEPGLTPLSLAAEELDPARFALAAVRAPAGPCGDLAARMAAVPTEYLPALRAAANGPLSLTALDELDPDFATTALPWLLGRSLLVREGRLYAVPFPTRIWLKATPTPPHPPRG